MQDIYNTKISISIAILALFLAPFVFFRLNAEGALDYLASDYHFWDVIVACSLVIPVFLIISLNRAVATFCAKDKSRVRDTMTMARTSWVLGLIILIIAVVGLIGYKATVH